MISFDEDPNVLIVDDEPMIRELLGKELKDRQVNYVEASTVQEAMMALRNTKFHVVLLDIKLETSSSLEVMEFIKSDQNTLSPDIQIIIISGLVSKDFMERNEGKVAKIFTKPFDVAEIGDLVDILTLPSLGA